MSDQLHGTPEHHPLVRAAVVTQLRSQPDRYKGLVKGAYDDFCACMEKPGECGDDVTLQVGIGWAGMGCPSACVGNGVRSAAGHPR